MPSKGLGRATGAGLDMLGPDDLCPDPDVDQSALTTTLNDHWWGGVSPPPAVQIPLAWLSGVLAFRQDNPYNRAEVQQLGGATARSSTVTSATQRQWVFRATVDSINDTDAANLARWITTYYPDPRPRSAALVLVLNGRPQTDLWRILGVTLGTHISITGAPAAQPWPAGATEHVVEGVTHQIANDRRTVAWLTAPIVGTDPGVAGPWFRYGKSRYSSTDARPF